MRLGLFYGSTLGHTAGVARRLAGRLGSVAGRCSSVAGLTADDLRGFDALVLGTSTWYLGALQDDWERFVAQLERADLRGVRVALFGVGDQDGFPTTFVDAMGRLRECVAERGADVRAGHGCDGRYAFTSSRALLPDGRFCGLALDEDNQAALTDLRLDRWCAQLRREWRLPTSGPRGPRRLVDLGGDGATAFAVRTASRVLRGAAAPLVLRR